MIKVTLQMHSNQHIFKDSGHEPFGTKLTLTFCPVGQYISHCIGHS